MHILITEPEDYNQNAINAYLKIADVSLLSPFESLLEKDLSTVDALVIRLKYKISAAVINAAPLLKYIISPTTGLDHIDEQRAVERGIQIISLKGETEFLETIPSTAELTWGLLLSLLKKIPAAANDVAAGNWNRQTFRGHNLKGASVGILGLGRVGKQVAKFALAFDMKVSAFDPYQAEWLQDVKKTDSAVDLAKDCDILIIHIPAEGNKRFVSASLLQCLRKGAYVINTSRGSVWDEREVSRLLLSGHLQGVATDVLSGEIDEEKRRKNPLLAYAGKLKNLIITPHIAGATFESMFETEEFVSQKFLEVITPQLKVCVESAAS
jgi:D-3-phosphoglycerate dehydrogenase